jgi:ribonucleoside-triphosphate reductase (thioredoxin)
MFPEVPVNSGSSFAEVTKRSGIKEVFNIKKIEKAIYRCLVSSGIKREISKTVSVDLSKRASNIVLNSNGHAPVNIEKIQDIVEQQLMAAGQFDAAKQYILFREEKRKLRETKEVSQEIKDLVKNNKKYFETPIQEFQFYDKYAKYLEDKGRRETWEECVERVMGFLRSIVDKNVEEGSRLTENEWNELIDGMLKLEALPSMRVTQMSGPALDRCNLGGYNCSYRVIDSIESFSEALYLLMSGCGVGFSVESDYVYRLPRIKKQRTTLDNKKYVIPDTTEGWCDALKIGMSTWYCGKDINFDFSLIRPQGARLKTKSGRSSGPGPLKSLLEFTKAKILSRQGKRLSTIDCHDILAKIGDSVQVGGTRRSALISLSDLDDEEMRHAKDGQFWLHTPHRSTVNNSAVYEEKPTSLEFMKEWLSLANSGSGERGIFNRSAAIKCSPKRRKKDKFGMNPCGETILRGGDGNGGGLCNLSIIVARADDTLEDLKRKARLATIFGTVQSLMVDFNYVSEGWKNNAILERLLGVDINGQFDCKILRPGSENRAETFRILKEYIVDINKDLANRFGINQSAATTCIKPGGNSSVLLGCSSGLHPRYAPYYIRRVRAGAYTPIARLMMDSGVPFHPETGQDPENPSTLVFDFPIKSPEGAVCRNDITVMDQLEHWLLVKENYTEHSASCTIYINDDEWLEVGNWVYKNFDKIVGLSFLPYNGGVYDLAPYQEITEEEYNKLVSEFPELDFSKLGQYELEDTTERSLDFACVSGACEL